MPNRVPVKPRAKSIRASDLQPALRSRKKPNLHAIETIDWLALWALSIGFSAIVLAALAFYGGGDSAGASMILFGAAIVIAGVLYGSATFDDPAKREFDQLPGGGAKKQRGEPSGRLQRQ